MTTTPPPPPAWFPDPSQRFELRYWDGSNWTEHVSRDGQPAVDPLEAARADIQKQGVAALVTVEPKEKASQGTFARFREGRRERDENRSAFEELAFAAAQGDKTALAALSVALDETRQHWRASKLEAKSWEVFAAAARVILADDVMTEDEEQHISAVAEAMGLDIQNLRDRNPALFEEVVIAGINDGRMPAMSNAPIILKRGEVAHGSFGVSLMKEVAVREFRAGTSSVSIPLGAGVRYRVGGMRGRSVVVGTDVVAEDQGVLCVTSTRSVFSGSRKTLEFRHDRLVDVEQYTDGIRLSVSNRQTASLLKMHPGESTSIAAALITTAVSKAL